MLKVGNGIRPPCPPTHHAAWISWGLTKPMWELMERCWSHKPKNRPPIGAVIAQLDSLEPIDERRAESWGAGMSPRYFRSVVSGGQSYPSTDDVESFLFDVLW